jgi:hypothetical protein
MTRTEPVFKAALTHSGPSDSDTPPLWVSAAKTGSICSKEEGTYLPHLVAICQIYGAFNLFILQRPLRQLRAMWINIFASQVHVKSKRPPKNKGKQNESDVYAADSH